jgi:hypothetical protein
MRKSNVNENECLVVSRYIPEWILPQDELNHLINEGIGATPDLIYARGILNNLSPDSTRLVKKSCTLLSIEVGFTWI